MMNIYFLLLVSQALGTTKLPLVRKSVSFHESVDNRSDRAREISLPAGKSVLVTVHEQLLTALGDLGLVNVSEDHFETIYVGLLGIILGGESPVDELNTQSVIDEVISSAFFQQDEERPEIFLPLDELLDLVSENLTTIREEARGKFLHAIHQRYHNMSLSDQRMIHNLYGKILSQIEF